MLSVYTSNALIHIDQCCQYILAMHLFRSGSFEKTFLHDVSFPHLLVLVAFHALLTVNVSHESIFKCINDSDKMVLRFSSSILIDP